MIEVIQFTLKEAIEKNKGLKGKTYREIADYLGLDHVSIWKMLNGKPYNPSFRTLDLLCEKLEIQPGALLKHVKSKAKK